MLGEQNETDLQARMRVSFVMADNIRILTLERDDPDGLIVTFSDGTSAAYLVEELLELRPCREPTENPRNGESPS